MDTAARHDTNMKTVNALEIRNHLGAVLEELESEGEPILISKGRKVRAVLISIDDFEKRFVDKQAEEQRREFLQQMENLRSPNISGKPTLQILREMRGYPD